MKKMLMYFLLVVNVLAQNQRLFEVAEREEFGDFRNLLEYIVAELGERIRCLVIIADSYYEDIIDIFEIRIFRFFPLFKLYIQDSDFFAPPTSAFRAVITESKKSGCNCYIILMTDGVQLVEMLQFVENERLIDTRGFFVLMFNLRLLHADMAYFWNRVTNVLFIQKYSITAFKNNLSYIRQWFYLQTVYYPVRLDKYVLTKNLNTWYNGRLQKIVDHFPSKTSNLRQLKLKVAVMEHIPAVTKNALNIYNRSKNKTKHEALGIEFELLLYISKALNFEPEFYKPVDVDLEKWGDTSNENISGLLGEAVKGKAAFYLGDLHNTLSHNRLLDLSQTYNYECMTFITPESLTDNSWKLLILPFQLYSWLMVIVTFLLGCIIVHFFSLFYKNYIGLRQVVHEPFTRGLTKKMSEARIVRNREETKRVMKGLYLFTEVENSALYIYSMLFQVSLPMIPRAWAVRVFIGCWWVYTILITVMYKASLTAALANPVQRKTIDTVAELAKTSIVVGGWNEGTKDFFLSVTDPYVKIIGNRFEVVKNEMEALSRVVEGEFCYYENVHFLQQARVQKQVLEESDTEMSEDELEIRNLHVMRDCLINMPVSLGLDKNSPLKLQVDHLTTRAMEIGLIEKWLSDVMQWSKIVEIRNDNKVSAKAEVNFRKFQGSLVLLAIGYTLGFLALICEILHWKYVVLRNPEFDKYHLDTFYKSKY